MRRRKEVKYWRDADLEVETASRIAEYEQKLGRKVVPPIPLESIAETLFDLTLLYQEIVEPPLLQILGGLAVAEKTIVINGKHLPDFRAVPGRERFTLAHEIGHWDLYEQRRSSRQGDFFGGKHARDTRMVCRSAGGLDLKVIAQAWKDDKLHAGLSFLQHTGDKPIEGRAVDRYASMLLMPKHLLLPAVAGVRIDSRRDLGPLAELFGVSKTALAYRLSKLKKVYVSDDGVLHGCSRDVFAGQGSLF